MATISAVLYANTNHPELKADYPNWTERCKQILKKWRALQTDKKQPYLQRARDNRSSLKIKKSQQVNFHLTTTTKTQILLSDFYLSLHFAIKKNIICFDFLAPVLLITKNIKKKSHILMKRKNAKDYPSKQIAIYIPI